MSVILAVETSSLVQSVAVAVDGRVLGETTAHVRRGHARDLARTVTELLGSHGFAVRDVSAYAIDVGPGSFTGLRVGLALVKGLAAVTGASVLPVRSVDAAVATRPRGAPIAVAWDAHNGAVYGAVVVPGSRANDPVALAAWAPEAFAARAIETGATAFVGDGWVRYAAAARAGGVDASLADPRPPTASDVLAAVESDPPEPRVAAQVEPLYVRRSAAEERRAGT